jgi:hypothetical protein
MAPLSKFGSTSSKPAPNVAGYRPLQYWIAPTSYKKHSIISIVKKDIRRALTFMMESLSSVTTPEALRLMTQAIYIICETTQSSFYGSPTSGVPQPMSTASVGSPGSDTLDYTLDNSTSGYTSSIGANGPNSLVKAEFLFAQCKPFVRSSSPLLWHAAAVAAMSGVVGSSSAASNSAASSPDANAMVPFAKRLWIALMENSAWAGSVGENAFDSQDPAAMSKALRQVVLQWLPTLAARDILSSNLALDLPIEAAVAKHLFPLRKLLFPQFLDDLSTIESKVKALIDCYAVAPASSDNALSVPPPPSTFLNVFSLLEDYTIAGSSKVTAVFRLMRLIMRRWYPTLFDQVMTKIEWSIEKAPWLSERLLELVHVVRDSNDPLDAAIHKPLVDRIIQMLESRSKVSGPLTSQEIGFYLPLISTISGTFFINPSSLLESLLRFIKRFVATTLQDTNAHPSRVWPLGDAILKILHKVLLSHKPRHLFGILRELLAFLTVEYPDVGTSKSHVSFIFSAYLLTPIYDRCS